MSRKCTGRLFQRCGPVAAKLLSPNVLCVRGTAHDLSVDEWSRRLGPSETKCMSSAKYGGAWHGIWLGLGSRIGLWIRIGLLLKFRELNNNYDEPDAETAAGSIGGVALYVKAS